MYNYDSMDLFCSWILDCGNARGAKFSGGGKTIVELSNRFRVVSNVRCDMFMQFESPLGFKQVPSRLLRPRGATPSLQVRRRDRPVTSPVLGAKSSFGSPERATQQAGAALVQRLNDSLEVPQGARGLV